MPGDAASRIMNFTGRLKNTPPIKFIIRDFVSLGIFVQKYTKPRL
jgi:hypothetical protein